jgi:riboflavin kinase/FMN adenylyltransferase
MVTPMFRATSAESLQHLPQPLHLALGVFDGVHVGHRAVIQSAQDSARQRGGSCGVVTFDPHPIRLLAPERAPRQLLASLDHKARLLQRMDMEFLLALNFDAALAALSAEEFIALLQNAGTIASISVGEDWRFGKGRLGDVKFLRTMGERQCFTVNALPPVMHEGERISSTRIRQSIRDGALANAAAMLGRPYGIEGLVVKGQQLGRTIGFPTANLALGEEQLPPDGVWAVKVVHDNDCWNGVANLGYRPTVDGTRRVFEVHLFDVAPELYGKTLEVEFVRYLREERKFIDLEALRAQIRVDAIAAREVFASIDTKD